MLEINQLQRKKLRLIKPAPKENPESPLKSPRPNPNRISPRYASPKQQDSPCKAFKKFKFHIIKKPSTTLSSPLNRIFQACSLEDFNIIEKTYLGLYYESLNILIDNPSVLIQKAICKRTNQLVIVKSCQKSNASILSSLRKESQTLSNLSHTNIAKFIENFETEENFHIVIEYFEGITLYQYLKNKPLTRLEENEVKLIFGQIVETVDFLHSEGVAHGDLKLENILIRGDKIKIVDFGFSAKLNKVRKVFCGTNNYLSPEITLFQEFMPGPADVWALGVIFFTLLTGTFPFKAGKKSELFKKIQKGVVSFPDYLMNNSKGLILKMFRIDPKLRPSLRKLKKNRFFRVN